MKKTEYEEILKTIHSFKGLTKECKKLLAQRHNSVHPYTLFQILQQETTKKSMKNHYKVFKQGVNYYASYLKAVERGEKVGILLRKAVQELDVCPALLARNVLQSYCQSIDNKNTNVVLSKFSKDSSLIPDHKLAYEIFLCNIYDDQYGPLSHATNDCIGKEYEGKLENCLNERNIPYRNEVDLRNKGYDKTPDCKLEIPIAVNGCIVNWIESKAQFGSTTIHEKYMKEQYLSYWNRFGPGLVIYWFGYLDDIIMEDDKKFIIMDHFPENITYMDPTFVNNE